MDGSTAYYERMKHMREALSIAGMQSSDWLRFEAALKAARKFSARAAYGSGQLASYPSLPTTIGNELRKTLVRAETCRSVLESADALYAVLSGKQRVLADRLLAPLVSEALTANATCIDGPSPSPRGGDAARRSPPPCRDAPRPFPRP